MSKSEALLSTESLERRSPPLKGSTRVYEIDPIRDPRWTELVENDPSASVFHSAPWLNALYNAYGYQPSVLTTSRPGERLKNGVVFCRIESWLTGKRIVSLPFSDHCEPLAGSAEELDAILQCLKQEAQEKPWDYLELRPTSQLAERHSGFQECRTYLWHCVDLSKSTEALLKSFDKDSVQRRIRRAQRESLTYDVGNSEAILRKFFKLFVMTRRRYYAPPTPYLWFRHLAESFGPKLQVRLMSYRGSPITGILTLTQGQTITYKYGCSDRRFNSLGATPLLFWRTIEEAQNTGFLQFDLGRSNDDNAGLIRFKEHWAARRSILHYVKHRVRPTREQSNMFSPLRRILVPIAPEWFLIAAGRLLYRHIG